MSVCSCFFVITQANKPEHLKNIETYDIIKIDNSPYTVTNGGKTYTYTYNDEGLRTSKTVDGVTTRYYYEGSLLVAEASETETFVYLYDSTGAPIGFQYRASTYAEDVWDNYYYEKNLQGDIVAVYDDNGNKIIYYGYDAWGNFLTGYLNGGANTTATKNPFRYRGYYYDSDLGLYYLQSRYYDAVTGRFINADGYLYHSLLGYNLFVYCNNNPVNYCDMTGESPEAILSILLLDPTIIGELIIAGAIIITFGVIIIVSASELIDYVKEKQKEKKKDEVEDPPQSLDDSDNSLPNQGEVSEIPDAPPVDAGKQGKHVPGHNNNDPDRSQWPAGSNGVKETQEAWQNGTVDPTGRPFGSVRIGQSSDGRFIRVHIDGAGRIHGYPIFP